MKQIKKIKLATIWLSLGVMLSVLLLIGKWNDITNARMLLILEKQEERNPSLIFKIGEEIKCIQPFEAAGKFYFFLPTGVSGKELRVLNRTGRTLYREEKEIANFGKVSINKDEELKLVWYGEKQEKREFDLYFMQETQVSTVFVDIDRELEQMEKNKEEEAEGKLLVYDAKTKNVQKESVQFRGHGNGAFFNNDKKSWRIKFNYDVSLLGLAAGKEYVAISNTLDKSYLRNQIVYDMADMVGFYYTPSGEYINLYVNGKYQGLYLLSEKIEVGEKRVYLNNELSGNDVTGYLFKEDSGDEKERELGKAEFIANDGGMFRILSPKIPTQKQVADLKATIENLQEGIEREDGICNTIYGERKHYSEIIDIDSFVKKYLIEEISKNRDGNERSSYYYIHSMNEDMKLYAGPVWDYDIAFGNWWGDITWNNPMGIVKYRLGFDQREDFMHLVAAYYKTYFSPYLADEVEKNAQKYAKYIDHSVEMDMIRWEDGCLKKEVFYNSVEDVINFLKVRKKFLDDVWIDGKIYHRVNYVDHDEIIKNSYIEDGKTVEFYVPEEDGKMFAGWYDEGLEEEWDYEQPVTDDMALWAKWDDE